MFWWISPINDCLVQVSLLPGRVVLPFFWGGHLEMSDFAQESSLLHHSFSTSYCKWPSAYRWTKNVADKPSEMLQILDKERIREGRRPPWWVLPAGIRVSAASFSPHTQPSAACVCCLLNAWQFNKEKEEKRLEARFSGSLERVRLGLDREGKERLFIGFGKSWWATLRGIQTWRTEQGVIHSRAFNPKIFFLIFF